MRLARGALSTVLGVTAARVSCAFRPSPLLASHTSYYHHHHHAVAGRSSFSTTTTALNANVLRLSDPQRELLENVDIFIFDCDGVIWRVSVATASVYVCVSSCCYCMRSELSLWRSVPKANNIRRPHSLTHSLAQSHPSGRLVD